MYATRKTDRRDDRPVGDYRDRDWSSRGSRRANDDPRRDENAPLDERTYGNVWTRVWENRDPRGRRHLTFSQHRVYEQDGRSGITKSFRGPDAEDVIRGAQWAIAAMANAAPEDDRPRGRADRRRDDDRRGERRTPQVRRLSESRGPRR